MRRWLWLALMLSCRRSPDDTVETDTVDTATPDGDGDGFVGDEDCDDQDATVHLGAAEVCNGVDDDCDGTADENAADASTWYTDADDDGYGELAAASVACEAPEGGVATAGDCDDADPDAYPDAPEACDSRKDLDCDGEIPFVDADSDGVAACLDCDDGNADVSPDAPEQCDTIDNDCDGEVDETGDQPLRWYTDSDNDGHGAPGPYVEACARPSDRHAPTDDDCDDGDANVSPEAEELCNGMDDDCDGESDVDAVDASRFGVDADEDGFGSALGAVFACDPPDPTWTTTLGDCDDAHADVHPGADETCDDRDEDCDAAVDEDLPRADYRTDADDDGYGDPLSTVVNSCHPVDGRVVDATDCNDGQASIYPGATEVCDGIDQDCDSAPDDGLPFADYWVDSDHDAYGDHLGTSASACAPMAGRVTNHSDCNDGQASIYPGATEICDGIDQDCDSTPDDGVVFANYYVDSDRDGYGDAAGVAANSCAPMDGRVTNNGDCNDGNAAIRPGVPEICNGIDDNCAAGPDDGLTFRDYYVDGDVDGYGDLAGSAVSSCQPVSGRVTDHTDCNDGSGTVNPGRTEVCNGIDDNCASGTDEGVKNTYYADSDGDSWGDAAASAQACALSAGWVANTLDCDDKSASIVPGVEACPWKVGGTSCKSVLDAGSTRGDGVYEVDWGAGAKKVYCDMTTDGGGWTALINPSTMTQMTIEGMTTRRTVQSGTGGPGCEGVAPTFGKVANGHYTVSGYACGTYTNLWEVDWTNPFGATSVRFTGALQGQSTRTLRINGTARAADTTVNAYMICAYWNGTATAGNPGTNQCWETRVAAPPHVYANAFSGPLQFDVTTGPACSPDCQHGTGFNLQKLYVR